MAVSGRKDMKCWLIDRFSSLGLGLRCAEVVAGMTITRSARGCSYTRCTEQTTGAENRSTTALTIRTTRAKPKKKKRLCDCTEDLLHWKGPRGPVRLYT